MPIHHRQSLLHLILLFAACALLRAPVVQAKTASGPFYTAGTPFLGAAAREAAPRLGLPPSTTMQASDVPDANNRQLHPTEIQWIRQNAKRFAQRMNGGQEPTAEQIAAAEQRLAQQAFREVQFGVKGETDIAAQTFLKKETQGMLLPGDPNVPRQNVGYMFYATPEQKANAGMYAMQVRSDPSALAFYSKNGITQPTLQQIVNAATNDSAQRSVVAQRTVLAAVAAGTLTLVPGLSGVAAEMTAFAKNPVGYCLVNPAGCMVAGEAVAYTAAGMPQPTSGVPAKAVTAGANSAERMLWGSWKDYPKVTIEGRTYAQVGDRLYTEHAVNRMQPSGLGAPAGELSPGRNISPNIVDEVIGSGQPTHTVVDGVSRTVYWSGNVGVVTENGGKLVVTILRRGSQ